MVEVINYERLGADVGVTILLEYEKTKSVFEWMVSTLSVGDWETNDGIDERRLAEHAASYCPAAEEQMLICDWYGKDICRNSEKRKLKQNLSFSFA